MKVENKYISNSENKVKPDASKIVISDDSFAVCEFICELVNELNFLRVSLRKNG